MFTNAMPKVVNQYGTMQQGGMVDQAKKKGIGPSGMNIPTILPSGAPGLDDADALRLAAMRAALVK